MHRSSLLRRNNRARWIFTILAVLAVAATVLPMLPAWRPYQTPPPQSPPAVLPDSPATTSPVIVVDLRDDVSAADIRDLEAQHNLDLIDNSIHSTSHRLMRASIRDGRSIQIVLDALRRDPRVETAEPEVIFSVPEQGHVGVKKEGMEMKNTLPPPVHPPAQSGSHQSFVPTSGFVPNDPRYPEQWNLQMVGAPLAWQRSRGKGVVVAVIDTGVAAANSPRGRQARDFRQTRFTTGYDFVHDDEDPYDDHGHGTHVAGTIAESTNNKEGVAGLAFEATIMPLKVLTSEGWGTSADIADAIQYAADHGANVINLSLGSGSPTDVIHKAVQYAVRKGVVIVCAAGNGFAEGVSYPAAFAECIAVSSVGPLGELAFYSSYGREVTLSAPGGDMSGGEANGILQNTVFPEEQGGRGDDYYFFQGTSMAAPHVAAVAALLMAQGIHDPARVRDFLAQSATPREPKLRYGTGILAAGKATDRAAGYKIKRVAKQVLFVVLAGLILALAHRTSLLLRLAFAGALLAGCLGPDRMEAMAGADSAWNLITSSALVPFFLFWELEEGHGSKIVAVLSLGVALGLTWNLLMGTLPFTTTTFGNRALLWTGANVAAALLLATLAWPRGQHS